jgi:hypothetical protein
MSALTEVGKANPTDKYERLYKTLRDSVLLAPGDTFADKVLFDSSSKHEYYKTPGFPSTSQAFKIIGIRVTPLVFFHLGASAANAEAQAQRLAAFLEFSKFSFRLEGNDVFDEHISTFTNFDMKPSVPVAAAKQYLTTRDKFSNFFKLPIGVTIPAGATFKFEFKPLKYQTEVTGANDMTLPNSGLASEKGYAVLFDLITTNVKERG